MLYVLVLEDDPIIAMDIKEIIDDMGGFCGVIASDFQSALHAASKHNIGIVVSDIQIKGQTDGIETTKRLVDMYGMRIIFLTSYSDEQTLHRASVVSFDGYLLKPFREEELVASLRLSAMKINAEHAILDIGSGYTYDKKRRVVFFGGSAVSLAPKEERLFLLLLHSRGNVVPFGYIDDAIWGDESVVDATRRQLFHRLKQKLKGLTFTAVKFGGYKMELY